MHQTQPQPCSFSTYLSPRRSKLYKRTRERQENTHSTGDGENILGNSPTKLTSQFSEGHAGCPVYLFVASHSSYGRGEGSSFFLWMLPAVPAVFKIEYPVLSVRGVVFKTRPENGFFVKIPETSTKIMCPTASDRDIRSSVGTRTRAAGQDRGLQFRNTAEDREACRRIHAANIIRMKPSLTGVRPEQLKRSYFGHFSTKKD